MDCPGRDRISLQSLLCAVLPTRNCCRSTRCLVCSDCGQLRNGTKDEESSRAPVPTGGLEEHHFLQVINSLPCKRTDSTARQSRNDLINIVWQLAEDFHKCMGLRRVKWMVGRRASASSHRYQKFSCVLAPIGDQHYSAAVRSASHSSQVVGLPS